MLTRFKSCFILVLCITGLLIPASTVFANPVDEALRAGDLAKAYQLLYVDARSGDVEAQYQLAMMCMKGQGVTRDPIEGVKWFREAAKQGHQASQEQLALALLTGNGVGQDNLEAMRWAKAAAKRGVPTSQYIVASMYEDGKGVRKDFGKAYYWYEKSANSGYTKSMMKQAEMLLYGRGVKKNVYLSLVLYEKAANLGDYYAKNRFEELNDQKLCYFSAQSELFGLYLKCVSRKEFHNEILARGGKPIKNDKEGVFEYHSGSLLQGSHTLEVQTVSDDEIAQVTYYFMPEMAMQHSENEIHKIEIRHLKSMLQAKYGDTVEHEGIVGVGSVSYTWQQKDGIVIELSQKSPGSEIQLSYSMPERLAKLEEKVKKQESESFKKHMMPMIEAF